MLKEGKSCIRIENVTGDKITYIDGYHYEHRFLKNMAELVFYEKLVPLQDVGVFFPKSYLHPFDWNRISFVCSS